MRNQPTPRPGILRRAHDFIIYNTVWVLSWILIGWRFPVRSKGGDCVPRRGGVLILCNHQSYLDPLLVGMTCPRRLAFLARRTLMRNSIANWFFTAVGSIKIDRDGVATEGIRASVDALQADRALVVWPEGTRTETGELGPLKAGVLLLLRKAQVPVRVVGIAGSYESYPRSEKYPRTVPIGISYAPWTPPAGASNDEALASLRAAMLAAIAEAESLRRPNRKS